MTGRSVSILCQGTPFTHPFANCMYNKDNDFGGAEAGDEEEGKQKYPNPLLVGQRTNERKLMLLLCVPLPVTLCVQNEQLASVPVG